MLPDRLTPIIARVVERSDSASLAGRGRPRLGGGAIVMHSVHDIYIVSSKSETSLARILSFFGRSPRDQELVLTATIPIRSGRTVR
jgi:hypothetical protein